MNYDFRRIDVAFKNGKVITVDEHDTLAEAVGIKGNKIVFVGTNEELDTLVDSSTKVIDLQGRSLTTGFIDTHIHPFLIGSLGDDPDSPMINLFGDRATSVHGILDKIREVLTVKKPGEWISMWGYEVYNLEEHRDPTLEELDAVAPENPGQCMEGSGHKSMFNSKALETIGVYSAADASKYPEGNIEVKDGKLTGMVYGITVFLLWSKVTFTPSGLEKAALSCSDAFVKAGLTSIHDMGAFDKPCYHIMQKLCRERRFKPRVYMALHSVFGKPFSLEDNEHLLALGYQTGLGDEFFRVGSCKFMIDGGSSGPSCFTREPYSHDPTKQREKAWDREEVAAYIKKINDAECQATAHAIGDGAIEYMVEGYEKAFAENPRPDLRHRIEHCSLTDQDLIDRMAKMNICPSVNAPMVGKNGSAYARFFGERNKYFGALRSMLDAGIKCSIQSDAPSGPFGIPSLDAIVNRYDRVHNVQCDRTQAISVLEAVRCFTLNGAYASYEENIKGSIEVGKLADLVVLSDDILEIPPMSLIDTKVDLTMIGGEIVYTREDA